LRLTPSLPWITGGREGFTRSRIDRSSATAESTIAPFLSSANHGPFHTRDRLASAPAVATPGRLAFSAYRNCFSDSLVTAKCARNTFLSAHRDGFFRTVSASFPRRKNVNWYPYVRPDSAVRWPV
jgi:hypothetical protein